MGGPAEAVDWQILITCQNESARIGPCLLSIREAVGARRALVTLNVNGSTDNSEAIALTTAQACGLPLRIYRTRAGDKANIINQFIYFQRVPAEAYFFIDGYTRISPQSLSGLAGCLNANPNAMASTGVATNGRTMHLATRKTLEEGGVLHGQLHALRPDFLDRMVAQRIRLPLGLYWGDGLMGSMAAHNLDAVNEKWDNRRIVGVAEATYEIPQTSILNPADLRRHFRRRIRQMRGRLQNRAITDIIYRLGYAGLPEQADDMVRDYLAKHGVPALPVIDRLFMALALRQLRRSRPADPTDLRPEPLQAA